MIIITDHVCCQSHFTAYYQTFQIVTSGNLSEFYVTDDTPICDPYEFLVPYLRCRNFTLTEPTYPYLLVWIFLVVYFFFKDFFAMTDIFKFYKKRDKKSDDISCWDEYVTPEKTTFICNTYFFNRTKASLRLDYEPIYDAETSKKLSIDWYKNELKL